MPLITKGCFKTALTFLSKEKCWLYYVSRARGADFQVGGLTRTRKREPTRGVRGHARPGKFEILFF